MPSYYEVGLWTALVSYTESYLHANVRG